MPSTKPAPCEDIFAQRFLRLRQGGERCHTAALAAVAFQAASVRPNTESQPSNSASKACMQEIPAGPGPLAGPRWRQTL